MQTISIIGMRIKVIIYDRDTDTIDGCLDVVDILGMLGAVTESEVNMVFDAQKLMFAKMGEL